MPLEPGGLCEADGAGCTAEARMGEMTGNEKSKKKKSKWVTG